MTGWLLSIVGVVFLGVLFDLIYPNGKTNNLCKSIFSIVAVFVMVAPILQIDINSLDFTSEVNAGVIENIGQEKIEVIKFKIIDHLESCGISNLIVKIDGNLLEDSLVINKIYIDSTNIVLSENVLNINKYEVISKEIVELLKISEEKVIVYG